MSKKFQTSPTNVNKTGWKGLDAAGHDYRMSEITVEGNSRLDDRPGLSIWAYTEPGWQVGGMGGGCHTIHEDNIKAFMYQYSTIEPCDCESCIKEVTSRTA